MIPRMFVLLGAAALAIIGLVMVYSASSISGISETGDPAQEAMKQLAFSIVGLLFAVGVIFLSRRFPDVLWGPGIIAYWGICMVGLVATAAFGTSTYGAQRWLIIGSVSVQVSEFAKIAFIVIAARIASQFNEREIDSVELVKRVIIFIVIPLVFLFFSQSDMGTTAICAIALLAVLAFSGFDRKVLVAVIAALFILGIAAIVMASYRSSRFVFLDPWSHADDEAYQLIRGFKAFAAGGIFGQGIGNSYEKMLYLPMSDTDFIYAIVGEEMGLIGAMLVVLLFLAVLYGSYRIALQANSQFEGLMAAGLGTMIVFQAFLNICCVIGIAPTTGKPLPFISSGGSSLISSYLIIGIILAVSFCSHSEMEYRNRRDNLRVVSSAAQPENAAYRRASGSVNPSAAPRAGRAGSAQNSFRPVSKPRQNYSQRGDAYHNQRRR